jgi:WhiB family redox-sensing transcriptional regulator
MLAPQLRAAPMPALAAAACRGLDLSLFFPAKGSSTAPAKAVCAGCPELDPCRRWALGQAFLFGVWGGTTENERRTLRQRGAAMSEAEVLVPYGTTEVEAPRGASVSVTAPDGHADAPPRRCSVCGGPIAARSLGYGARTCSATCRTEARRRRQRAASGGYGRRGAREVTRAVEATPAPAAHSNGAHGPTDRLGPIYAALALAGATVVRVEVEVAGECWLLTRAQGGQPR